jgi:uncharacterized membrane protein (UPF0127 family)
MRITRRRPSLPLLALLALPLAFAASGCAAQSPQLLELSSFPRSALTIHATGSSGAVFRVWIADTPQRQEQGLMFVRDLPADEGMLFVNEPPRAASMWMKNTFIPLDMVYIDARGRIVRIFERTVPQSLQVLSHPDPVKAVLELRGGECARRGIRPGDTVDHPAFKARPGRP